ncbi:hypothetical protein D3C78_1257250 [compost metagenome]
MVGRQPPFAIITLAEVGIAHRFYGADRRRGHQNIERLFFSLGGVSDFLLRVHPAESKATLMTDITRCEDTGQGFGGRALQKQAVTQQLRDAGIGINNFDCLTHPASTQVIIEHQRGFYRGNAALTRHVRRFGEGDGNKDSAFFNRRQLLRQLSGGLILIEMIARLRQPVDTIRPGYTASGKHQKIIGVLFTTLAVNDPLG